MKKEVVLKKYYSKKHLLEELKEKINMIYDSGGVILTYDFTVELFFPKDDEQRGRFIRENIDKKYYL